MGFSRRGEVPSMRPQYAIKPIHVHACFENMGDIVREGQKETRTRGEALKDAS